MPSSRRRFLGETIFALVGTTAGAITLSGCTSPSVSTAPLGPPPRPSGRLSAGLGWAVQGLENDSAFAYLEIARPFALAEVRVDASLESSGPAQALCQAWVSRGTRPSFPTGGSLAPAGSDSPDFGAISLYSPGGLSVHADATPRQDVFYSAVLMSPVPTTGVDSVTAHGVRGLPSLVLSAGDYLVLAIEQRGVSGDVQLQMSLDYE
jgi:hypothetical protein